jgi:hypothetical protein
VFYTYRTAIFVKEPQSENASKRVRGGIVERRGKKLEKCTREEPGGGVGVFRGGKGWWGGGIPLKCRCWGGVAHIHTQLEQQHHGEGLLVENPENRRDFQGPTRPWREIPGSFQGYSRGVPGEQGTMPCQD